MELVRWQQRRCTQCPEGRGCNLDAPWMETTPEVRDIAQAFVEKEQDIPAGTHVELHRVEGNRLNRYLNTSTGLPFRKGDIVPVARAGGHSRYLQIEGVWEGKKRNLDVAGGIFQYWTPTHLPISRASLDEEEAFWGAQYAEAAVLMAQELKAKEFERLEQAAFANFVQVLKAGTKPGEIGPRADFIKGESWMKAGTGWRFLKNAGACPNPVRYIRGFPEEMPVAEVWHDYLRNGKDNPIGQHIEWYWVTTIVNYAPGLLRECTLRAAKWLKENRPDYARNRDTENHHFDNEVYRHAFFDLNPWPYIEFRLRLTAKLDKSKTDTDNGYGYGSPRFQYTPNELDIRTGLHTMKVPAEEEKPQEQEAAAAKAA